MCVPVSPRHFLSPVVVAFLVGILAFPASAQTGSDPNTSPSTSTAGAQAQSDSTGGRTSSNPVAPKTDVDTATPSTQTNSAAAKAESEPRGSQPQPNPGPKDWLGNPYQHQQSQTKNDGLCGWDRKISLAGINRSRRIFNSIRKLYCDLYERNLV